MSDLIIKPGKFKLGQMSEFRHRWFPRFGACTGTLASLSRLSLGLRLFLLCKKGNGRFPWNIDDFENQCSIFLPFLVPALTKERESRGASVTLGQEYMNCQHRCSGYQSRGGKTANPPTRELFLMGWLVTFYRETTALWLLHFSVECVGPFIKDKLWWICSPTPAKILGADELNR